MPEFVASFQTKVKLILLAAFFLLMWTGLFNLLTLVVLLGVANLIVWRRRRKKIRQLELLNSVTQFSQES